MTGVPDKPTLDGLEAVWDARWAEQRTYRFDRSAPRARVFAIDTPPPTVSGSLHLGTVFGYVQTDAIARFHRMRGQDVFYPMGWDDNGLPTERRVQNVYGVRCDPALPYEPGLDLQPVAAKEKSQRPISRRNFVELCTAVTQTDEQAFEQLWRTVGLSVDWTLTYATIDERSRRAAQRAFLRALERGEAYAAEAPTLWDVDFRTAVAQAELEDREVAAAYHRIRFDVVDSAGGRPATVDIETTRPELLPALVALVAHPDDARYQPLFGATVRSPIFGVEVPVVAHPRAEPDKGSGIAMVCTFGDTTDVLWWRELGLPVRSVVRRDGRFVAEPPPWLPAAGVAAWPEVGGRTSAQARRAVVDLLTASRQLVGAPKPITHAVKFFEKGDRPLEIVTSRQWYIRNGANDPVQRERMLARGRELHWHPAHMRIRYERWVEGLNTDWLISRQRFFGVPFPVWHRLDGAGEPIWGALIVPDESTLPVDPSSDIPPGYDAAQRGQPDGFVGDPDVMDTWATSSLTPQIAGGWIDDPALFERTFPMDLRPQGPEIIRTWLFATVLRSDLEFDRLPWAHTSINGWILDPDRKKMSKSKGNVVTPQALLDQYGADGVRYWACNAAPGTDTAADPNVMKVGRRLANKVLNASKFVLGVAGDSAVEPAQIIAPLDRSLVAQLAEVVDAVTASFEDYRFDRALERAEEFFWMFCDDYVELVKVRAYGDGDPSAAASAHATLRTALDVSMRLLAPFLPFVTAEAWSWWRPGSVHRAAWPTSEELRSVAGGADGAALTLTAGVLSDVRKAKSALSRSLRTPVRRLVVTESPDGIALLRSAVGDLAAAGVVADVEFLVGEHGVEVDLEVAPVI